MQVVCLDMDEVQSQVEALRGQLSLARHEAASLKRYILKKEQEIAALTLRAQNAETCLRKELCRK
jgi:hypothetical protein